jgi:chemotaxis protein methyltransferase CheR
MIYEQGGIFFNENKEYLLENRLSRRLELRNCQSFEDYYYYLRYNPAREVELLELFNLITIKETSFFRNPGQLRMFENGVLGNLIKEKGVNKEKKLKIWSAGCSTREEPYTLAIIKEHQGLLKNWNIEIIANVISEAVLQSARRAIYSHNSVRNTPPAILTKYFSNYGGNYMLKDEIRNMVRFYRINLLDRAKLKSIRGVDIIFCRNVLIYFGNEARKQVISSFYDALNHNGYLFLGHSEALHNNSPGFILVNFEGKAVYRKG